MTLGLIQFNNSADVKYDNVAEISKTEALTLTYWTNVHRSDCQNLCSPRLRLRRRTLQPTATKGLESKTYRIGLGSDTMACEDIVKWIEETTSTYSSRRAAELNSKRYLVKYVVATVKMVVRSGTLIFLQAIHHLIHSSLKARMILKMIKRFLKEKEFYESVDAVAARN